MNLGFLVDAGLMFCAIVGAAVLHDIVEAQVIVALGGPRWPRTFRSRIDPIGTIVLPGALAALGGPPFGYAAPVPLDAGRLRGGHRGLVPVALAGFATYLGLALAAGLAWRALGGGPWLSTLADGIYRDPLREVIFYVAFASGALAVLNLLPVQPLDASKLVTAFLTPAGRAGYERMERYAPVILFGVMLLFRVQIVRIAYEPLLRILEIFMGPP